MPKVKVRIPRQKIKLICQRYPIHRLALFGSVLREDFRPDSDIDILVVFNPEAPVGFMMMGKLQRELSMLFNRQIDLVPQNGLKPTIRDDVLASAEDIYAV